MSGTLEDLKNLLEGAKILEVKNSERRESICEFVCEKDNQKYSFTLFATDLGAWVENRQDAHGNYMEFPEMLAAIFEHHSSHSDFVHDLFKSLDNPIEGSVEFICGICEWKIKAEIKTLKNTEFYEFLDTPENRKQFARVLSCGYIQDKHDVMNYMDAIKKGTIYSLKPLAAVK